MTARDIIKSAMRQVGLYGVGETPTDQEINDGLADLNDMLDSWNADRLSIYTINRSVYTLPSSTQSVTLGTGGTWNAARPPKIERMSAIPNYSSGSGGVESGIEYPIDYTTREEKWQQLSIKSNTSSWPYVCYDSEDFPLRTLKFWPVPNGSGSIAVYAWSALTSFATLNTNNTFPPGYAEALKYNLALRLAVEFPGQVVTDELRLLAVQSKARIESFNEPEVGMQADAALTADARYGRGIVSTAAMNGGFFN